MLLRLNRLWQITKKHAILWYHAVLWEINHITVYKRYISKHSGAMFNWKDDTFTRLPLNPKIHPFNKEKADAALQEVLQWIEDEQSNSKKDTK